MDCALLGFDGNLGIGVDARASAELCFGLFAWEACVGYGVSAGATANFSGGLYLNDAGCGTGWTGDFSFDSVTVSVSVNDEDGNSAVVDPVTMTWPN
ncbi:hypothetical protein BVX99_03280 [bacterium F16]|nr:hypothetical protein BVX99_03280 [bacterium F16]